MRRLLEVVARERPLIVVLEDLHWADSALLDLIEDMAESSREAPFLLVCAARPELLDLRPHWGGGKVNAVSIQLAPLDPDETKQLVGRVLGGAAAAGERERVQEYVADRSNGNPLLPQGRSATCPRERSSQGSRPAS